MNFKYFVKKSLADLFYYSGVLRILRYGLRSKGLILAYHRVLPDNDPEIKYVEPGMYVTVSTFRMHMEYIKKYYNVVSLDKLFDTTLKNKCVITFDDGWYDNYKYAFPILKEFNIPATIFLVTNFINSNKIPWTDKIFRILIEMPNNGYSDLKKILLKNINEFKEPVNPDHASEQILTQLKKLSQFEIKKIIKLVDSIYNVNYTEMVKKRQWLNWEEIKIMHNNLIDFGAHTHNHIILGNSDLEKANFEIETSINIIKDKLDQKTIPFCYPNGSFNSDHINILKKNNVNMALTTIKGLTKKNDDFYKLNRILIHNDISKTKSLFALRIINV